MNTVTQLDQPRSELTKQPPVSYVSPEVNIFEDKDGFVLEAEMPGVRKDGLEITLEGNEITIIGRRREEITKAEVLYRESRPADYRRVFELDPAIDISKISANLEQGILTMHFAKSEKVKPRKISIS